MQCIALHNHRTWIHHKRRIEPPCQTQITKSNHAVRQISDKPYRRDGKTFKGRIHWDVVYFLLWMQMVDTQGIHLVNISILELQDLFCYFWLCTVVLSGGITPKLFWSIFVQDWFIKSNTTDDTCGTGTAHPSEHMNSPRVFSGVRVARFVDYCLSFCLFSFGHCIVCPSIYRFWLSWYFQTFL